MECYIFVKIVFLTSISYIMYPIISKKAIIYNPFYLNYYPYSFLDQTYSMYQEEVSLISTKS